MLLNLVVLLTLICNLVPSFVVSSYLSPIDKVHLRSLFESALSDETPNIKSVYFAVRGLLILGHPISDTAALCKKLSTDLDCSTIDLCFLYGTVAVDLKCNKISNSVLEKTVTSTLASTESSAEDIFYAVATKSVFGHKLEGTGILKQLNSVLKADDSVVALGYAFQIASLLPSGGEMSSIFNRIEDAVVQADDIDGHRLQFEAGLEVTRLILTGILRLADRMNKAPVMSHSQTQKFANYILQFRSTKSIEFAFYVVDCLNLLSSNKFLVPVAIAPLDSSIVVVSDFNPSVTVSVTDLMGNVITSIQEVSVDSIKQEESSLMSTSKMIADPKGRAGVFQFDFMSHKPVGGFFDLTVSGVITPLSKKVSVPSPFFGHQSVVIPVKVLSAITVDDAEIGVVDADQAAQSRLIKVKYPDLISNSFRADHHYNIILRFGLTNSDTATKGISAHQVFVRLAHKLSGKEIIFVAEQTSSKKYKFELAVAKLGAEISTEEIQLFEVHLIVGDPYMAQPISWHIANVELKSQSVGFKNVQPALYKPKPEIHHVFRQPELRPSQMVSNIFVLICLSPILVMVAYWFYLGINVSDFPFNSLYAYGFHGGLLAIFILYFCFWLKLNMFVTMKYLVGIGVVTFLCGNKLLVHIALKRKQA